MNLTKTLEERLDFIEFRQDLLFTNSKADRILYEYNVTRNQYTQIMNLMDECSEKLSSKQNIGKSGFENKIYKIFDNRKDIDYHFCEYISKAFMEQGRWEEVFPVLYGDLPKYKNILIK